MVKVLNFCNYNLARFGDQGYRQYLNDPRVVIDRSPQCMDHCYECLQSPIAQVREIVDSTNVSLEVFVLLTAERAKELVKCIEKHLEE